MIQEFQSLRFSTLSNPFHSFPGRHTRLNPYAVDPPPPPLCPSFPGRQTRLKPSAVDPPPPPLCPSFPGVQPRPTATPMKRPSSTPCTLFLHHQQSKPNSGFSCLKTSAAVDPPPPPLCPSFPGRDPGPAATPMKRPSPTISTTTSKKLFLHPSEAWNFSLQSRQSRMNQWWNEVMGEEEQNKNRNKKERLL